MSKCSLCGVELGDFASQYKCINGYVCDSCLDKSDFYDRNRTVQDFKRGLSIPERSSKKADVVSVVSNGWICQYCGAQNSQFYTNCEKCYKPRMGIEGEVSRAADNICDVLLVDNDRNTFRFVDSNIVYAFYQLDRFEYIEEGRQLLSSSSKQGGITRAVVGGLIAGEVGALVGTATAKNSVVYTEYISNSYILIETDSMEVRVPIIDCRTAVNSQYYNKQMAIKGTLMKELDRIKQEGARQLEAKQRLLELNSKKEQTADAAQKTIPQQIAEYKSLLDNGAITEEEYNVVKKKLLDSI